MALANETISEELRSALNSGKIEPVVEEVPMSFSFGRAFTSIVPNFVVGFVAGIGACAVGYMATKLND